MSLWAKAIVDINYADVEVFCRTTPLVGAIQGDAVRIAETAVRTRHKQFMLKWLRQEKKEVAFKRKDAPNTPGRPASGGNQLKCSVISLLLSAILLAAACGRASGSSTAPTTTTATASNEIALENSGVALMGKFDFQGAIDVFERVVAERPDSANAKINLAIATLNRQREGDSAKALEMLEQLLKDHPENTCAHYCRGILLLNAGEASEALGEFQTVAQKVPDDAFAAYWTGQCLATLGRPAEALPMFVRAAELKSTLRSAYYGEFQALQKLGRTDEAKQQLAHFQELKDNPQAQLVEFKYTRMGLMAEAQVFSAASQTTAPLAPAGPAFSDAKLLKLTNVLGVKWGSEPAAILHPSITVADIDGDGKLDLFITSAGLTIDGQPRNAVVLQRDAGQWELARDHPLAKVQHVNAALWGDFDNDSLTDVYLCRSSGGNELWRQSKGGVWEDVTERTRTAGAGGDTIDGAFVDTDHDGDLDLFLIHSDRPNQLLNNDGDGQFRDITSTAGVAGDGSGAVGLVVNDLDHDDDVDFIVLKKQPPHEVYLNDLRWHFHRGGDEWKTFSVTPCDAAIAADADADGQVELYSVHAPAELRRWSRGSGMWNSEPIAGTGKAFAGPLAIADLDGTGELKLLFRNRGVGYADLSPISTASAVHALNDPEIRSFATVLLDPSQGPVIVAIVADGAPAMWPTGPGRLNFAAVTLSGRNRDADQMRSNASGVGAKLAVRIGDHWTALDTYRSSSGPGQSAQPVTVGLRGAPAADFIRLTWPEGLRQTESTIAAGSMRIEETQRQTSSCPVIFAWDGRHYAFVTDCLGVGGIGFALGPNEFAPERPRENVLLPGGLLKSRQNRYALKLAEPMEEACYLDAVSLVSYDLPSGWSMTLDERMATGDPEPTGEPCFYRRLMLPSHASNDRGKDITEALRAVDHLAADPGAIDPHFIGHLLHENVLTLTFDEPIDASPGAPMLLADGWIEYPYSQTMFAAWQAQASYDPPTIEAESGDGQWVTVLPKFGYPAGMPRQMSVPLAKLPPRTKRIRIRTTMEIYWDRLAIAWAEPCPQAVRRALSLQSACVKSDGFAQRTTATHRRPIYDDDRRAPLWSAHFQDGFYTEFGPATDLVRNSDDAVCIFGPGEAVEMEFAANVDQPAAGFTRQFVLQLAGWCKDRDLYTKDGGTIQPLPLRAAREAPTSAREALHAKYNTRFMSGGY